MVSTFTSSFSQVVNSRQYNYVGNWYRWQGGIFIDNFNLPKKRATTGLDSGALSYNTVTRKIDYWDGDSWEELGTGSAAVDSIWRVAGKDSIFFRKNGTTFKIKDSVGTGGGGGSLTLQQVTDNGNTTTNDIIVKQGGFNTIELLNDVGGYINVKRDNGSFVSIISENAEVAFSNRDSSVFNGRISIRQLTANRSWYLPNKSGTIPLSVRLNGTTYTSNDTGSIELGTIGGSVASVSGSGISLVNGSSQIKRLKAGTGISITDNTDSVTITNTAASLDSGTLALRPVSPTFGQQYYQTNERVGFYRYNGTEWVFQKPYETLADFWFPVRAYNTATGITLSASGGGDYRVNTGVVNFYNSFKFYTAASAATTGFQWGTGSSVDDFVSTDSNYVYYTKIILQHLSDATNTYTFRAGINVGGATADGQGMYFKYTHGTNSGQWQCITQNALGTNTINTSSAPSASTVYDLVIVKYGSTKVEFFINGSLVATSTSNISNRFQLTGAWLQRSAGTGERSFSADRLLFYRF